MSVNAVETQSTPDVTHKDMANSIRALAMDAVEKANSGHPGMPMGMADVATVLFSKFMKFDPSTPNWPDRDRAGTHLTWRAGHNQALTWAAPRSAMAGGCRWKRVSRRPVHGTPEGLSGCAHKPAVP